MTKKTEGVGYAHVWLGLDMNVSAPADPTSDKAFYALSDVYAEIAFFSYPPERSLAPNLRLITIGELMSVLEYIEETNPTGFAQKVVFRDCREAEGKFLQQLSDFLGKAISGEFPFTACAETSVI